MSKRYGGKYSPQYNRGASYSRRPPRNAELAKNPRKKSRLKIYRALSIPIGIAGVLNILGGNPIAALVEIGVMLGVLLATQITDAGIEAEEAYNNRAIARPPAWPRKTIGAIMMGLLFAIGSHYSAGMDWLTSGAFGIIGLSGMLMSFGSDPMRGKGLEGINMRDAERTADAIEKAEATLGEIRQMATRFKNRALRLEVENLAVSADEMFRTLEKDPSDYRNARRYLSVYLTGARDATAQYLALPHDKNYDAATKKYQALIEELEGGFRQKQALMLEDNRNALDIEIDVLRERLASEGVTITKEE